MEISSFQHHVSYPGKEKYEMLELNKRLESYLNHVKLLEEENQLLCGEIQAMRRNQDTKSQWKAQEEALSLARKELQNAWRAKDFVELEVSNLLEEMEELNILRQKEKSAHVEAKKKLEESRRALEEERRMQIWLRKQAAHLEKEITQQVQNHQEDMTALRSSCVFSKPVQMVPQHSQTLNLQGLGEEYSQRATQAWREAAGTYQTQMKKLEESLDQTRAQMTLLKEEKKQSQLQVQDLAKELDSTKAKRELLEKNMVQQRQRQSQDLQHLQAHVEDLEAEKLELRDQIGELLVESCNLLQMKMSLSLEVATYRTLLDSESLRCNNQSASMRNRTISLLEGITKSPGIPPGSQASFCLFSTPLNTTSRSITHKANLMTPTPTWNLTLRTPHETLKRPQTTKEEEVIVRAEEQKLETATTISKKHLTEADSHDHYRAEEEASSATSVSASEVPEAVDEPILTGNVKEDLQEVLKAELGPDSFSTNETTIITLPVGHPETPEDVSSGPHIEEAKISEDGDEEETEVSTEMAQISHAPVSAWAENETVIPEERDVVSDLELESEDVPETSSQKFRLDADQAELQLLCENTNEPVSLLQEIPHLSTDTFSPVENDSEILTWGDVKEDVIHFVEEESLKSAPEVDRKSGKGTEKTEDEMEIGQAEWPGIKALESPEFDIKVQEEETETKKHDKKVEQSKEEELTNGEEERMIEEDEVCEQKAELVMSAHGKDKLIGEQAEVVMDTFTKDNQVGEKAKAVMVTFDKDQFVEHNTEEDQGQTDEDESLNISASWRTDPGDADSYAQENTIADTRPLIHYKSDEETDANIPIAHLGVSEPTDSEEEREKHEGSSHWSQIIAKRFDTMEDLSEEPELGSMDDIVTDKSVQSVLRQSMDEESVVQNESGDMDSHVKTLMDDALEDQSESDHRNNSNENSQGEEETKSESYHLSTFPVEEQEDSSQLHETREVNEQQTPLTMQVNISEDGSIEYREDAENLNKESIEIHPEGESEDKKYFETSLLEPSHEQALEEEPCEEASTEITHSDVLLFETAITKEQAYSHYKAEDEASSAASVSASEVPEAVDEPILTGNVKEDLQEVLKAELGPDSFSTNETTIITLPVGHPETPEDVSSGPHIEEAKISEDGDEEETEVSTEMAQISHAPVSAWEENETVIPEERDVVSDLELESEDVPDTSTQEFRLDADQAELQLLCENTNEPVSLLQEIPHLSTDTFSPVEDDSEILTWGDVKEDVIHFVEEESLKSAPEVDRKSGKGTEKTEDEMEIGQAEWPGIEALESPEFDIKVQEEETETKKHDKKVEQSKKEELTNGEEERMIEGDKVCEEKAELVMSAHGKDNLIGVQPEVVMDTFTKDNQVGEKAKAVMVTFDKDQFVEHNTEEDQGQTDEDESLNISASWRTDPGDADSYAQENTIADTRPLIHYKSDEETDANIPIAHLGVSEPTDSEEEREKHEGSSHWSQIIAKRFDTMEDLSEEPELGSMDDIVTDKSVQSVLRQSMDEESVVQNERGDMDSHVKTLMDDALEDQSESDHRNNSNENSQGEEDTKSESYHLSTFSVEEQEDSSQLHETREVNEQQTPLTMQVNISEDASIEYREDAENWNKDSIEIHPEGESEDKKDFDPSLLEPFHEQALEEEPCEEASTEITHSDVLLFETAITEEQICPKEEDVQSNLSMLTHADFTDEFYLHSFPESQTNTNDSDLEEPNSSEDESPNVSLNSQLLSQQLDQDSATTMDVDPIADPLFTGLVSDVLKDENSEDYNGPQAEDLENKEEQQYAADSSSRGMGENAGSVPQEWENLGHEITSASQSIAEEFGDEETESKKDNMEIFQRVALREECQTNKKENDLHSFFSSSIKEGIWSETKFEMAATYDPNDQTETERYTYDSINPNQTMAFGEDWENPHRLPPTNSKPEKDMGTSIAQSIGDEEEEQEIPQGKQVQCRDVKDRDEEAVHAANSTDEGDSWSSGEE